MSLDSVRELVGRLTTCANTLSAVGMALQTQVAGEQLAPEVRRQLDEVLVHLGLPGALADLSPAAARPMLGEIRMTLLQGLDRLNRGGRTGGWAPTDPQVLQAAGEVSAGFPTLLQRSLSRLDGLGARLEAEGARFLDVGVGVAVLSIEMARLWPRLQVVGIDVWTPALALGHENLARAGMQARIELREQAVQELADQDAFDLAWLPSVFVPGSVIPQAVGRLFRSLRPGGWLIFATFNPVADALGAALGRLRLAEWGGSPLSPAEAQELLTRAGFAQVTTLPGSSTSLVSFAVGQRP